MPESGTGERVTPVLDFPSRDGLSVQARRRHALLVHQLRHAPAAPGGSRVPRTPTLPAVRWRIPNH